jgi:hypothetical protein
VRIQELLSKWAVAGLVLAWAAAGSAEVISLHPVADATLLEVNPSNSAGGAGFFLAGTTQNRTRNRALLQFDVAGALPLGAQITAVGLQLEVTRRPSDGFEPSLFGLHRVLRPWGEGTTVPYDNPGGLGAIGEPGDATWLDRFTGSESWAAPGGQADTDYRARFSSSTLIYDVGAYHFEGTLDMVADVQFWLDDPASNFGWMLIGLDEDLPFTARRFASREDPNGPPVLTVEFTVVPEPRTWVLAGTGACFLLLVRRRRR